jgi:hypothetical protein
VSALHVFQEIGDRFRGALLVELDDDDAVIGVQFDHAWVMSDG